ncbi:hypothetical protein [Thiohalorhabdus sp.]|uniref:hypothetical protein n=1 Tax=Thiohalorhabdus sp. TaxID=3094134 RepID=UPI002FC27FCC
MSLTRLVPAPLRPAPKPRTLRQRFFDRYAGCCLIVHQGFPDGWLGKLVHEPGGGGHFRIDVRHPAYQGRPPREPAPVQWLVREHILPLELPLPLLVRVEGRDHLRVRHMRRHGGICQPEEVFLLYEDIEARPHALLLPEDDSFAVDWGIDVTDNAVDTPYGMF